MAFSIAHTAKISIKPGTKKRKNFESFFRHMISIISNESKASGEYLMYRQILKKHANVSIQKYLQSKAFKVSPDGYIQLQPDDGTVV